MGEVERFLKHGLPVDSTGADGVAALGLAARYDHTDIVELLVSQGARIDHQDQLGRAALHHASEMGSVNALRFLLECGANAEAADRHGRTPLMYSASGGEFPAAEALIRHGADVNAQDNGGCSALMHAMLINAGQYCRRFDLIKLLISSGADPLQTNEAGQTAVQVAEEIDRDPELTAFLQEAAGLPVTTGRWDMVGGADCVLCRKLKQRVLPQRYPDRISTDEVEEWLGASLPGRVKYSEVIPFRGSELIRLDILHAWHAELCERKN